MAISNIVYLFIAVLVFGLPNFSQEIVTRHWKKSTDLEFNINKYDLKLFS